MYLLRGLFVGRGYFVDVVFCWVGVILLGMGYFVGEGLFVGERLFCWINCWGVVICW